MTEKPTITIADFTRLLRELHEVGGVPEEDWFEKHGIEDEVVDKIGQSAAMSFLETMEEGMRGGDSVPAAFGKVLGAIMLSGFALGWETCEQLGRRRRG